MINITIMTTEKPKLIGFMGKKRVGKDTSCDYLINKYGYTKKAFAENLKSAAVAMCGFTDEQLNGDLKEVKDNYWGFSPRQFCQFFGTDLMRKEFAKAFPQVGENFWIMSFEKMFDPEKPTVISDVRYPNEVEIIRKHGGVLIWIGRETGLKDGHISENAVSPEMANIIINNNGTKEDLYRQLELAL